MVDVPLPSKIEMVPLADLRAYARNARTHSEAQVAEIAASIREFGFTNPALISDGSEIIAGHGRVLAADLVGLDAVPCIRLGHLTEAQRQAYVIADNKLALNADWDREMLVLELRDLAEQGFDLGLTGFKRDELDELFMDDDDLDEEGATGDDEVPEGTGRLVSRPGDVWVCGKHRVMCGSSTDVAQVERLCVDGQVDMVWTDPPYNVAYESVAGSIANDDMGAEDFEAFLRDAYVSAWTVLRPGGPIYVAHADTEGLAFRGQFEAAGFKLSGCLIWVKPALVLGRSDYQWRHEPILYGWKPGAAHVWVGGRAKTTVVEFKNPPFVLDTDGAGVRIDMGGSTLRITGSDLHVEELAETVIRAEKPARNDKHPTMKPVELILGMVKNSSKRGDVVLDLFGGSGSTLIACQKCGRHARLMELEPRFVDVIVRRWQEFTGLSAYLEGTSASFDELQAKRDAGNG